jgi:hypothetical protein
MVRKNEKDLIPPYDEEGNLFRGLVAAAIGWGMYIVLATIVIAILFFITEIFFGGHASRFIFVIVVGLVLYGVITEALDSNATWRNKKP